MIDLKFASSAKYADNVTTRGILYHILWRLLPGCGLSSPKQHCRLSSPVGEVWFGSDSTQWSTLVARQRSHHKRFKRTIDNVSVASTKYIDSLHFLVSISPGCFIGVDGPNREMSFTPCYWLRHSHCPSCWFCSPHIPTIDNMPVPRRRKSSGISGLVKSPGLVFKALDINFMFQKSKTLLLWGFTPAVILTGMLTEPAPASWFELINIW